jgi:hypothetical protein
MDCDHLYLKTWKIKFTKVTKPKRNSKVSKKNWNYKRQNIKPWWTIWIPDYSNFKVSIRAGKSVSPCVKHTQWFLLCICQCSVLIPLSPVPFAVFKNIKPSDPSNFTKALRLFLHIVLQFCSFVSCRSWEKNVKILWWTHIKLPNYNIMSA